MTQTRSTSARSTRSFAALALFAAVASPALAATSWSTPAGTSDTITYSSGQTQSGLFTDSSPTVGEDKFLFFPHDFTATSGAEQSSDTASVLVTAKAGRSLGRITAGLSGDWSVLDGGTSSSNSLELSAVPPRTSAVGTLTLTNPLTQAMIQRSFDFTGQFTSADGSGAFSDTQITLPLGWKSARISLSAGLTATAEPGSTAFIQLKGASIGVETRVAAVPLPPAALAAIPGVAVAYFARRRVARA